MRCVVAWNLNSSKPSDSRCRAKQKDRRSSRPAAFDTCKAPIYEIARQKIGVRAPDEGNESIGGMPSNIDGCRRFVLQPRTPAGESDPPVLQARPESDAIQAPICAPAVALHLCRS